jgi:hypothetical protein
MSTHTPPVSLNIDDWLALIQAEYYAIPGLGLTTEQAQRLWGLDECTCEALFDALEAAKVLRRTSKNLYVRASAYR